MTIDKLLLKVDANKLETLTNTFKDRTGDFIRGKISSLIKKSYNY